MTISYHSGRRIQGQSTDFASKPAVSGGWKELGRTTLGSASDYLEVSGLADKRYYKMIWHIIKGTSTWCQPGFRLGNSTVDTTAKYPERASRDGATDATSAGNTYHGIWANAASPNTDLFGVSYFTNLSAKEKLAIHHSTGSPAGAGSAPSRLESVGKWINTSDPLDLVRLEHQATGNGYNTNSECVILGWDESDTHTTNFWEELYTDTKTSDNQEFSTGTIAAKKYLWLQFYQQGHTGNSDLRFNADGSNNYARRHSINGASDASVISQPQLRNVLTGGTADHHTFTNMFIINSSANEKLCMFNTTFNAAGGSGAGTAPQRIEGVGKWTNGGVSAQITSLTVTDNGGAGFDTGSTLKIWGSD